MFNKNSIFFTLGISFFVSLLLLIISFFTIHQMDKSKQFKTLKKNYYTIGKIVDQEYARFGFTNDLKYMIDDMDLILIEDDRDIQNILYNKDLKLIFKKRTENILLHIFQSEDDNFLHFQTPFEEFVIIDKDIKFAKYNEITLSIFLLLLFMILLIAYSVYKKLSPLNELTSKIEHIGNKNMRLEFLRNNAQDEVSLLAKALLEKSEKLNDLKTARDIFIRNIMHELKTPITKGRFLAELEDSKENKQKLQKVFYQLESLINEFASIEEVISKKENIEKKDIFFDDIIENVLDILMIEDEEKIITNQNNIKINVNFKLFSIAVKNLIDNAIKYSNNSNIYINIEKNSLSISNTGEKLQYNLEKYYEPFFNNHNNNTQSFGLGLYIVHSILEVHQFKLSYSFENGKNTFTILL